MAQQTSTSTSNQTEKKGVKDVFEKEDILQKLDHLIETSASKKEVQILERLVNRLQRAIESLEASGVEMDPQAFSKWLEGLSKEERVNLARAARRVFRGDDNVLLRLIAWAEEKTGNWLPAVGKTAGYGYLCVQVGQLTWKGAKLVGKILRRDVAGAAEAAADLAE